MLLSILLLILGLVLLTGGTRVMMDHATIIAQTLGIREAVVGLTFVAAGTSMPERATSVVAVFRRQTGIAVGTIVGSNLFNVLCIGGGAGLVARPSHSDDVGWIDDGFRLGTSAIRLPLMWSGFSINRWEGLVLLTLYGASLFFLWQNF